MELSLLPSSSQGGSLSIPSTCNPFPMASIIVFGSGAIGSYVGGTLRWVCCRFAVHRSRLHPQCSRSWKRCSLCWKTTINGVWNSKVAIELTNSDIRQNGLTLLDSRNSKVRISSHSMEGLMVTKLLPEHVTNVSIWLWVKLLEV